ncbi:MAG: T9SS type A sorting domain-containing protein, partial [Saprospiraceae bacterium]
IFTVNVTGGDGPYYYNWEILNGFCHIVAGQNTPTVQISISFKTLFLKVTVTDSRGCQTQCVIEVDCTLDGSTIVVVDPELVDISKPVVPENLIEDYTLRPNPTSSQVYLEFDADAAEEITVNISNQFGKPVYHKKMNCSKGFNSQLLETSSLPSGLYQVSLISSDKLKTLQLIKVK